MHMHLMLDCSTITHQLMGYCSTVNVELFLTLIHRLISHATDITGSDSTTHSRSLHYLLRVKYELI